MSTQQWARITIEKSALDLPQRVIDRYLRLLEKKRLVHLRRTYARATPVFEDLYTIAAESLRSWYTPFILDKPETLIAQEMAAIVLGATPSKVRRGLVKREDLGRLSNIFARFLQGYHGEQDERLMRLLVPRDKEAHQIFPDTRTP